MMEKLPSFEIIVTHEEWLDGEHIVHKLSYDTTTISQKLHPEFDVLDYYAVKGNATNASIPVPNPIEFYTDMAARLTGVSKQKLAEHFSDIKVNFKNSGTEAWYKFLN